MPVEYLNDRDVDAALDAELRGLLSTCFQNPWDDRFRKQRYYHEMPQHRWLIRDGDRLVAHTAAHDKVIGSEAGDLAIGGIAEVCVHPDYRGRGFVREMLAASHAWLIADGRAFSVLFGDERVYRSSGYVPATNPIRHLIPETGTWVTEPIPYALVRPLTSQPWPAGEIDLRGPTF